MGVSILRKIVEMNIKRTPDGFDKYNYFLIWQLFWQIKNVMSIVAAVSGSGWEENWQ